MRADYARIVRGPSGELAVSEGKSRVPGKVLIVDDSPTEVLRLRSILESNGYRVLSAGNGDDGIREAQLAQPDVILMDVVMPGLNGFQATRQLHRDPATANIPVVILSTKGQPTDRVWGLRQGAADYLVKPVSEGALVEVIERLVSR